MMEKVVILFTTMTALVLLFDRTVTTRQKGKKWSRLMSFLFQLFPPKMFGKRSEKKFVSIMQYFTFLNQS